MFSKIFTLEPLKTYERNGVPSYEIILMKEGLYPVCMLHIDTFYGKGDTPLYDALNAGESIDVKITFEKAQGMVNDIDPTPPPNLNKESLVRWEMKFYNASVDYSEMGKSLEKLRERLRKIEKEAEGKPDIPFQNK